MALNKYFRHPVSYVGIVRGWISNVHYGIDYGWNSSYLPSCLNIYSAAEGTVKIVDYGSAIGNYIVIFHGTKDGKDIYTQYKHLASTSVKVGDKVTMQTVIGIMGDTGTECDGRHLHFDYIPVPTGKSFNQSYRIDPATYVFAFNDITIGTKGQGGVTINKKNMTITEAMKLYEDEPTPTPTPTTDVYVVQKGDTMGKIAAKFGMTLNELIALNPQIKNPNLIYVGDKINIKKSTTVEEYYTIQKGDTLTKIAKAYGTTVDKIMALNAQIKNKNLIYPGDKIRVK